MGLFDFFTKRQPSSKYAGPQTWSDADYKRYPQFIDDILHYNEKSPIGYHPAVQELKALIESSTRIELLVSGMCDELVELGQQKPRNDVVNALQNYHDLLKLLNYMVRVPPLWNTHMFMLALEAAPYYLLMQAPMHTTCGFAFFQDPQVNAIMKQILDAWGVFLLSPDSAKCLDESPLGWFGPEAYTHLTTDANLTDELLTFEEIFVCDPSKPHRGFTSWDNFFTRQFRDGIRPVVGEDDDSIVANVCESMPWRVARNVQFENKFWAKGGPYSIKEMLGHDERSHYFAGGTVYQAYLSALAYHRWHSPVNGTIVKTLLIPGLYFSEPQNKGFGNGTGINNPDDPNWEQSYQSATATRAVIFIQADNPDIGLMAVILIGMSEVSTCETTVEEGQRIKKGEQLGMFHFGGSTHCVLFGPHVDVFDLPDTTNPKQNWPLRGKLARVARKRGYVTETSEKQGW